VLHRETIDGFIIPYYCVDLICDISSLFNVEVLRRYCSKFKGLFVGAGLWDSNPMTFLTSLKKEERAKI
jgi:hypothetical protein